METKTHLAYSIEKSEDEIQYDESIKDLFSDRQVLAKIMKYAMREFKNNSIEEIMECICGTPEVSTHPIYPGMSEKVVSQNTESKIKGEGYISYDIIFPVRLPDNDKVIIYVNIEPQRNYYPGYHFVPRGVFYCTRKMSEQLDTDFTTDNYDGLRKVVSIWICIDAPKKYQNTITRYRTCEEDVYGKFTGTEIYDLLEVIIVRLPKSKNRKESMKSLSSKLLHMLNILLASDIPPHEKEEILSKEHGLKMTKTLKGGLQNMCNYSESIKEEGLEEGLEKAQIVIARLMKGDDPNVIADEVGVPLEYVLQMKRSICKK